MKNQKLNILGLIMLFFLLISLGSCMTSKEWIQKDQQDRSYDAALKRLDKLPTTHRVGP